VADTSTIGPELGFGSVMGDFFDEPVLLIKEDSIADLPTGQAGPQ